jgi:MHS family alpha-ketoglutarate permease-like MFS transporter
VISFYTGISGIVKAELFPTNVRALGVGLAYALANATFGGTAEFMALWFKDAGIESTFFWYVTVMLAIAFVASLIMPNPRVHGYLDGAGTVEEALGKKPVLARA